MKSGDRVRSIRDGQLGYIAEDETGRMVVRLDRPAEQRTVPYFAHEWKTDGEARLTDMQIARVCHDADAALRAVQGEYGIPTWLSLRDQQRMPWINGVPGPANELRRKLYLAIKAVFV